MSTAQYRDGLDITLQEWEQRKAFAHFVDEDIQLLQELRPYAEQYADEIIEELYHRIFESDEARSFFADPELLERVKQGQREYFVGLTSGSYGESYLADRLRIGRIHQRIGLPVQL